MWYPATVTVPADEEPVSLTQVKAQSRIDFADDDALVTRLISAARAHVEAYCGTKLAAQTAVVRCDCFDDLARLPMVPVQSVSMIGYVDTVGAAQTLSTDVYELRADGLEASVVRKYGQSWPAIQVGSRITVTCVAGYDEVPPDVRHAVILLVADMYENREPEPRSGWSTVDNLLCNHRVGV